MIKSELAIAFEYVLDFQLDVITEIFVDMYYEYGFVVDGDGADLVDV